LTTDAGDLDLLGEVAGLGGFDAVKATAEAIDLFGHTVWVLSLAGLNRQTDPFLGEEQVGDGV
jgi:hypothetical protein